METRGHDRPDGRSLNSEINVTPLVDVMLVVLIIFILVTPLLHDGTRIELPRARHAEDVSVEESRSLTVALNGDGSLWLGEAAVVPDALAHALRARREADPELQLRIQADQRTPYGEIQQILRAGRAAGFRGAALVTREPLPESEAVSAAREPLPESEALADGAAAGWGN